jgi:FtsH-binding integral membrane protein
MKNTIYYLILCIASTLLFVYTLWKKKDNKLVVLYFFIAGYTYFLEYFVLVLFNGYSYNPAILKNEYYDNISGAVASDAFVIPMISTFVSGFKLSFMKRFFIAAIITIIEIIFVRIHIFEVYWWKHFYTFAFCKAGRTVRKTFCPKAFYGD